VDRLRDQFVGHLDGLVREQAQQHEAVERLGRRGPVDGGGAAVVAHAHRGEHVEGLGPAALTHHDTLYPQTQALLYQVTLRHLAAALGVARLARTALQLHHMRPQQQLVSGLDGGDTARRP